MLFSGLCRKLSVLVKMTGNFLFKVLSGSFKRKHLVQICSFQKCFGSSYVSPFQDHEVYDGHRTDYAARDGPVLMQGSFYNFYCF